MTSHRTAPRDETLPPLLEMPAPFITHFGKLRLLEPLNSPKAPLCHQLLSGTYRKPFIVENAVERSLFFDLRFVQSTMEVKAPDALILRYTQKMMAFLLFNPCPSKMVLIGLGGGSLVKFCHRQLPECQFEVVELDPDIIALAPYFGTPASQGNLTLQQADGARYLQRYAAADIDVLLIDAFDRDGIPSAFVDYSVIHSAYQALSEHGILVINLGGERSRIKKLLRQIDIAFAGRMLAMDIHDSANHILLAFKNPMFMTSWKSLRPAAEQLEAEYGLDFPVFLDKLEASSKNNTVRQIA